MNMVKKCPKNMDCINCVNQLCFLLEFVFPQLQYELKGNNTHPPTLSKGISKDFTKEPRGLHVQKFLFSHPPKLPLWKKKA